MATTMEEADRRRSFSLSRSSRRRNLTSLVLLFILLLAAHPWGGRCQSEFDIVIEIKQELGNPPGLGPLVMPDSSLCGLLGQRKKDSKPFPLVSCANFTVIALDFGDLQINSTLPKSVVKLPNLVSLTLKDNLFFGEIPRSYGSLTKLSTLSLSNNNLTGPIPEELGNLKSLQTLGLSGNHLSGNLPKSLGGLTSLTSMNIYDNNLIGRIPPEIGNIKTLQNLRIKGNRFTGEIPPELGNLPNLVEMQLFNTHVVGSIPESFGGLTKVQRLYLYNNSLDGNIPKELGNLASLIELDVNANKLTGGIPPELGNLTNIQILKLNNNNLTGRVPAMNLTQLKDIQVQNNYFAGEVPLALLTGPVDVRVKGNWFNNSIRRDAVNGSNDRVDSNCFTGEGWSMQRTVDACEKHYAQLISDSNLCMPCIDERRVPHFDGYCKCLFPTRLDLNLYGVDSSTFDEESFAHALAGALSLQRWQVMRPHSRLEIYMVQNQSSSEAVPVSVWLVPSSGDRFSKDIMQNWTQSFETHSVSIVNSVNNYAYSYHFVSLVQVVQYKGTTTGMTMTGPSYGEMEFSYRPARPFTMKELREVTADFDQDRVIGKGGFGWVYKATLASGEEVAVKRSNRLKQFVPGSNQFKNEVELLWRVHHRNLVRLIGYCDEEDELLLVYQFMKNGSLADCFKVGAEGKQLSWKQRLDIAVGAARGLHYLHTAAVPPVIHRDIKPDNILLDENMVPGLSDLGISKLMETEGTHITTHVAGTFGYLDPEYMTTRQLNDKSDVYSFGIVLLQLVTGQHASPGCQGAEISPLEIMVQKNFDKGGIHAVIDNALSGDFPAVAFERLARLALQCSRPRRAERPDMHYVLSELEQCSAIALKHTPRLRSSKNARSPVHFQTPAAEIPAPLRSFSSNEGSSRNVTESQSFPHESYYVPRYGNDTITSDHTMSSLDKTDVVQPR